MRITRIVFQMYIIVLCSHGTLSESVSGIRLQTGRFDVPRAPRTADAYPSSIDNVL